MSLSIYVSVWGLWEVENPLLSNNLNITIIGEGWDGGLDNI